MPLIPVQDRMCKVTSNTVKVFYTDVGNSIRTNMVKRSTEKVS